MILPLNDGCLPKRFVAWAISPMQRLMIVPDSTITPRKGLVNKTGWLSPGNLYMWFPMGIKEYLVVGQFVMLGRAFLLTLIGDETFDLANTGIRHIVGMNDTEWFTKIGETDRL